MELSENTFFFTRSNRARVKGANVPLTIANGNTIANQWLPVGIFTIIGGALLYVAFPFLWWLIFPIGALILYVASVGLVSRANTRFNARLAHEGVFLLGEVTECFASVRSREFKVTTKIRFRTPNHTTITGQDTQARPELDGKQLPAPGTPIVVLYFTDEEFYLL